MTTKMGYLKITYYRSDDNQKEISECNITQVITTNMKYLKVTYYCNDDSQQEITESKVLL